MISSRSCGSLAQFNPYSGPSLEACSTQPSTAKLEELWPLLDHHSTPASNLGAGMSRENPILIDDFIDIDAHEISASASSCSTVPDLLGERLSPASVRVDRFHVIDLDSPIDRPSSQHDSASDAANYEDAGKFVDVCSRNIVSEPQNTSWVGQLDRTVLPPTANHELVTTTDLGRCPHVLSVGRKEGNMTEAQEHPYNAEFYIAESMTATVPDDPHQEWGVTKVSDCRTANGYKEFRVHWKSTWVRADKLNCDKLVKEYFKSQGTRKRARGAYGAQNGSIARQPKRGRIR